MMERFQRHVREFGGSETQLADVWATVYAELIEVRERGRVRISSNGWKAARDYMHAWVLRQPSWISTPDSQRQEVCDQLSLDAGKVADDFEQNRQRTSAPRRKDPITGVAFQIPYDSSFEIAERAARRIASGFVASERPAIERLLLGR